MENLMTYNNKEQFSRIWKNLLEYKSCVRPIQDAPGEFILNLQGGKSSTQQKNTTYSGGVLGDPPGTCEHGLAKSP
jgi:hypothetical protein